MERLSSLRKGLPRDRRVALSTNHDFPQVFQHARRNFHFIYISAFPSTLPGSRIKIYKISRDGFPSGETLRIFLTLNSRPARRGASSRLPHPPAERRRDKLHSLARYTAPVARSFTSIASTSQTYILGRIHPQKISCFLNCGIASNCFQRSSRDAHDIAEYRLGQ